MFKLGVISQERLKIEVKLPLSANIGGHVIMPRRLAQQRMTFSDPEWPFYASRAISAVAELFVCGGWLSGSSETSFEMCACVMPMLHVK